MHLLHVARTLRRRWLLLFLCCLAVRVGVSTSVAAVVVGFPDKEAEQRRAEFLGYDRYRRELSRHGFRADLCPQPLEWPRLKEFNVIVYGGFGADTDINSIDDPATRKRAAAERQALEKFVSNGGGLIVLPCLRRYPGQAIDEYFSLVLEGFGVKVLPESVWDPSHHFTDPGNLAFPPLPYFTTTQFKRHAVTRGVERLALPKTYEGAPAVAALVYSKDWTVVATAEDTAQSYKRGAEYNLDFKEPGTYKSAPPLVAVRQFGKGRVFCYPLPSAHLSLNFGNPLWPHTVETRGNAEAKQPSFSQQLVLNALAWLSEPSQKLADFGQRKISERVPPVKQPEKFAMHEPPQPVKGPLALQRGIIGAHTNLSDGQGSVEEYAQAAADAKLQFVVFAESLEHLTADKWRTLVEKCREISQKGPVYLVPGYEYSDVNGVRWAMWGKQVIYPRADYFTRDGKRIFRDGNLVIASNLPARMLLEYDKLPGDPANMWWFYNVPIWVYDEDKLVADNLKQYLLARDRLYAVTAACFTRIKSPKSVAAAARRCTWNVDPAHHPNLSAAVDTSLAQWDSWTSADQGGADGPRVAWGEFAQANVNDLFSRTRGGQRVRGSFRASADAGLKEVRLHDGARRILRRYLCGGAKEFNRTFELVQDRQHELVLEAVDREGRRAICTAQRLFSYQQGFYRCGDNLNLLGSTPTVAHPDRQEFPRFPTFEDMDLSTLNGFDTGVGLLNQPEAIPATFSVQTTAGNQEAVLYLRPGPDDSGARLVQTSLRFPFASYQISVVEASSTKRVKELLDDPAQGPFMPESDELPYAAVDRRVYLLRSRMNYPVKWAGRRPHEGAANYQGDVFVHEGAIRFRRDVTLQGALPIKLERVMHKGGSEYGQADRVRIADADRGDVTLHYGANDKHHQAGTLRKGGWIAGQFTDAGMLAAVPAVKDMRYEIDTHSTGPKSLRWDYYLGLGRDGQTLKKGEKMPYRYLAATISGRTPKDASTKLLQSIGRSFGLDAKGTSPVEEVEVGQMVNTEVFVTGRAKDHEFVAKFRAAPLMIDRPLRIEGVEDNGCVAVFALKGGDSGEKRFRFVGVFEGAALFQHNTDGGPTLWVGNPFYAEDAKLRLTLVADGLGKGGRPFLEVHNPTDSAVKTVLHSPEHTPGYGGFSKQVTVPAGDSIKVDLPNR
ncbi:MAG TPA: hypothetical protein VH682_32675 [Gemmataceae bacterium]|jgi:hypothetical protein